MLSVTAAKGYGGGKVSRILATAARVFSGTFLIVSIFPAAVLACDGIGPVAMVPGGGTCAGVSPDAAAGAYTYAELTGFVDGEAGLFDAYGFVAAAFQNCQVDAGGSAVGATLSLFNQGTPANAQALYGDAQSGSGDPIPDWAGSGEARWKVAFGVTSLQFYEECFFGRIVVISDDAAAAVAARCLGEATAFSIQGEVQADTPSWGCLKTRFE